MKRLVTASLAMVLATLAGSYAASAHEVTAQSGPPRAKSTAWYVPDSCGWTAEDKRNCSTVLRFLAAFDLGRADTACKELSGRYLAQRNIGGIAGCAAYLRRHGASKRIEYSIISSRLRPDGGEVVYTINPPRHREIERRFVAITIVEHGATKIDAVTAIDS
jgi:hypothetical protein